MTVENKTIEIELQIKVNNLKVSSIKSRNPIEVIIRVFEIHKIITAISEKRRNAFNAL
jgi:hypothetical protein